MIKKCWRKQKAELFKVTPFNKEEAISFIGNRDIIDIKDYSSHFYITPDYLKDDDYIVVEEGDGHALICPKDYIDSYYVIEGDKDSL